MVGMVLLLMDDVELRAMRTPTNHRRPWKQGCRPLDLGLSPFPEV